MKPLIQEKGGHNKWDYYINNGDPVTEQQVIDYINTGTVYTTNLQA